MPRSLRIVIVVVVMSALGLGIGLGTNTCADDATGGVTTTLVDRPAPSTTIIASEDLRPVVQPTLPSEIPGYLEVDPATGLTMTGTPVQVDVATYRLTVRGKVDHELSLTYDEIRLLPKMTADPWLECPGYFVDRASWSGVPLTVILDMAGVRPDASRLVMKAADGYTARIGLDVAQAPDNFLAYELEGETLPALQGFPLRVVLPERQGGEWVKWLTDIVIE